MSIEDVLEIEDLIFTITFRPSVRKVIDGMSLTLGVVRGGQVSTATCEHVDVCARINRILKKYSSAIGLQSGPRLSST